MCTSRSWNDISYMLCIDTITARRSDDVFFQFFVPEFNSIPDFIEKLESYRNCKCSQTTPCDLHKQKGENKSA